MKMPVSGLCCVVRHKLTEVSEVLAAWAIALMLEAENTSETSVNYYQIAR